MANPYMEDENPYMEVDTIPNTENFIQKAINNSNKNSRIDILSGISGGLPAIFGGANNAEDVVPGMTQFGTDFAMQAFPQGRIASMIPGVKLGTTLGATGLAELGRQGVKGLRGEGINLGEAGKNTAITAGTELAGRGLEKMLFGTQIGKDVISGAKKRLGGAIRTLSESGIANTSRDAIVNFIDHQLSNIIPIGSQASSLRKLRNIISRYPETLTPKQVSSIENVLNGVSQFDAKKAGQIVNKEANIASKSSRKYVSDELDRLGNMAGVDIAGTSKEAHLAQKFNPPSKKGIGSVIGKFSQPGIVGSIAGLATHNPAIGIAAGLGDIIFQQEPIKNFLYNLIVKSGASRTSRVGISDIVKRNS